MLQFIPHCTTFPVFGYFVKLPHRTLLFLALTAQICLCVVAAPSFGQSSPEKPLELPEQAPVSANQLSSACMQYNSLNTRIRDGRIDSASARIELRHLLAEVRDEYFRAGGGEFAMSQWAFPLAGYDTHAIGGGKRHGYIARGYDFFRGNRHGGHPAYDIFIRDRNQDGLDDRGGSPVKVLSVTGGVVVALEGEWEPGSRLKGGRYIWVYDPANDLLVYYAHNAELFVKLGEIVRPGDVLAVVGRSGFNAAKRRSPTHLHLSMLKIAGEKLTPVKAFEVLQRASSPGRAMAARTKRRAIPG